MGLYDCGECGFPGILRAVSQWNSNGTITGRSTRLELRSIFIEADFLNEFIARLEERLGIPLGHVVYEAQRNASVEIISGILGRAPAFITRIPGAKRAVVSQFCRMSSTFGMSYAKVVKYRSGKVGEALIRNPFNRDLMAAIIVGAFEALEDQPFSHTWRDAPNGDIIHIEPESSRPEIAVRLGVNVAPVKPGHSDVAACPFCGYPQAYRDLEWSKKEGTIMDLRRGVRMVYLDAYTPMVVIRELVRELGDEVNQLVVEAHKAFCLTHLRKEFLPSGAEEVSDRDRFCREALDAVIIRAQGNPVEHGFEGDVFRVTVENSFSEHLLAGWFAALYELIEGKEARASWEYLDLSTIRYTISPAPGD